ncbi:hypothetical protein DVH24_035757 [Malus domestica]|uniref:Uncharacterized protein n=1 Tax=Malus domestica TaxID=3750 RepID=A0A498JMA4_MALDO|nr:hypothetical protein DVH24_035757 [Malus domestica]
MWWLWWMQVRRDKIEEATKKTTLKRQERSICLGRREKDRGGGYGGYKREGIGKTTEKRGLKREERENLFRQRRRELSSAVDSGRTPNHQPTVFAGSVVGIGWLSSIDLIEVIRKACALYNNWWPMLTGSSNMYEHRFRNKSGLDISAVLYLCWVNATKFLTGASAIGSIAIPAILKHAGVIGWGALAMELSSFFVFVLAIMCYIRTSDDDDSYSSI